MKIKRNESGMVIVEATIVFPVMFLVIFLLIFAGNAYTQKCRVDAVVNKMAIEGAAYCADPMLDDVESGKVPGFKDVDIQPYRFLIGGMDDIEDDIDKKVNSEIKNMSTGLFSGMKPSSPNIKVKFNNGFIYSTFSVEVNYKICIPIRLLGQEDFTIMKLSSQVDIPVSATTEFIRNVDMVEDYMERSGVVDEIKKVMNKVNEWLKK